MYLSFILSRAWWAAPAQIVNSLAQNFEYLILVQNLEKVQLFVCLAGAKFEFEQHVTLIMKKYLFVFHDLHCLVLNMFCLDLQILCVNI